MKNLIIINGTMGVGKTTVSQKLKEKLPDCVFLDGDWCWDMSPFKVCDETKNMVEENIAFLLNNFIKCSKLNNIVFCWVLHKQEIIDSLLKKLNTQNCNVKVFSLIASKEVLEKRLQGDVDRGIRDRDVIARSVARIPLYDVLNTEKINTDTLNPDEISDVITEKLSSIKEN